MTAVSGVVLFLLIWWTTLFAVLPLWTRPVANPTERGHFRGAPERPLLWRKLLLNTVVAGVLWGAAWWMIRSGWISFRPES